MDEIQATHAPRRRMQFGIRTLLEIITVSAFVLALIYMRSDSDRSSALQLQVIVKSPAKPDLVFVLDPETRKVWSWAIGYSKEWNEATLPVPKN